MDAGCFLNILPEAETIAAPEKAARELLRQEGGVFWNILSGVETIVACRTVTKQLQYAHTNPKE